jgi:hypothetical protein
MIKRTDLILPQILARAVKNAFRGMKALYGSAAVVQDFRLLSTQGGDKVKVPYFGSIGEWQDLAEGLPLDVVGLNADSEEAVVQRSGKAFEATDWARFASAPDSDPYVEAARQIVEGGQRRMDKALIDAALTSDLVLDVFNAGAPRVLDYDLVVDEYSRIATMVTHSATRAIFQKAKDSQGRPLYTDVSQGEVTTVAGLQTIVSDRCPVEFPALTITGTTPPAVTISGATKSALNKLRIEITAAGARGAALFRYSLNGGNTWTSNVLTAATVPLLFNGSPTDLVVNFPVGNYATDNVYVGIPKYTTMIAMPGSLALYMNGNPTVETDRDILAASTVAAVNAYYTAHRYRRSQNGAGTRTGVVLLKHN